MRVKYLWIAVWGTLIFNSAFMFAAQNPEVSEPTKPCLLVRPTEVIQTAFVSFGGRYEYLDSRGMTATKIKYSKHDLEKLQEKGVHIVIVQRDAKRDEMKQARESCTEGEKK